MDGDTGTVQGIRNVTYTLENERKTFRAIHFNRNTKYREKRRSYCNVDETTDYISTTDWLSESPGINRKTNSISKEYTKCTRCKRALRKTSIDFKPLKRILSSCSFVGKSKIKGISISPGNVTFINKIESSDDNLRSQGDNEVKVLYKRDFNRKEKTKQIISPRRYSTRNIETKNSQTSLFGFQRCIQRKRHVNYNLSVFYKLLHGDAKHHNVLRCKHYSFEDLNLDKPKKKSSFVKSQSAAPAHYNLVNFTQHSSISNVYLLKPKYYKKLQSLRKNKSLFRCSELDKRKSILKKTEDPKYTDLKINKSTDLIKLKTNDKEVKRDKEQKLDTKDNLNLKPPYKGVNLCKPAAKISNTNVQVEPKISTSRKNSKKSVELFDFLKAAMKYLLFIMTLIIWFPCILVLGLGWLITYPCRPHKASGSSKGAKIKRRRRKCKEKKKKKDKPRQRTTKKDKNSNKSENKEKHKPLFKKKKPAPSDSKKKKGIGKKCAKTCSDCTQYTVTPTGFYVPEGTTTVAMFPNEEIGACIKKRQKSVSFKQPCQGRSSETYVKISKNKVCSGCRDKNEQSVDICGDTNEDQQESDQNSDLNNQCQSIVIKSCKGKLNRRKIEVCVPKSLSKLLQSALRGTCSTTNQMANVRKIPKIKSCNSTAAACIALKKKRKCLSRQSKYVMHNLKRNLEVTRSSATRCLPSPCPGGCAARAARAAKAARAARRQAAGGGDGKKRKKTKQKRKKKKSSKPKTVMKFLPPPPRRSMSVGSNICIPQRTSKDKSLPRLRRCNRMTCDRQPLRVVSVSKMYAPVRPEVRTISSNTMMLQTSSFFKSLKKKCAKKTEKRISVKKFIKAPCPKNRHVSSNTRLPKPKKPRKSTTVVKFFPVPHQRLVHSSVNTRKLKLPSCKKVKSKSSSACLSSSSKVVNFFPKPCSSTIACSTCEIILPIEPLEKQPKQPKKKKPPPPPKEDCNAGLMIEDRKSYDRRHSQDMIPRKPARVCKFFPAPRYNTRTLGVGACIKEEIKLPRKSSKSTSFPQKTFFRSLSVTTGTSTCSAAPTQIIKYIKTHKSIMHRGTVPRKFKGDICLKQSLKETEKSKKPAKPCTAPGTKPATAPGKKPCLTSGAKISSTPGTKPCTTPGAKPGTTPKTKPGTTPVTKPCVTQNLKPCEKQSYEREHLKKRSTGFSTKPVQTRSRKVMLQTTYPVIRFQPRSQVVTCTRGVNTRKPEWCFVTGYRKFQQKRKLRKAADDQRKILICKKGAKSPKTSQSSRSSPRSSSGSPTPGSSKSALQAKQLAERKKQLAERKKQLAKEKAKGKSKEQAKAAAKQKEKQRAEALAKQKAKQRSSTGKSLSQKEKEQKLKKERAKAQAKQKAKERAKQKAKNRAKALKGRGKKSKPRKKKGKKNLKKNARKAFKKLASSGYEVKCEDMMASPNRPCKIIHDIWPSAYPAFMVLYKMYNSVCHLIFFVLACCIWSPLFCWCFMFYFFIIKRMFC